MWDALRARRVEGVKFRRQHSLGPFIVDFYASALRLAIEVDGPMHEDQRDYDLRRQRFLESEGIRFVRLSADEVERDLKGCVSRIRVAIRSISEP